VHNRAELQLSLDLHKYRLHLVTRDDLLSVQSYRINKARSQRRKRRWSDRKKNIHIYIWRRNRSFTTNCQPAGPGGQRETTILPGLPTYKPNWETHFDTIIHRRTSTKKAKTCFNGYYNISSFSYIFWLHVAKKTGRFWAGYAISLLWFDGLRDQSM
jgi:hypothetical protein